MSSFSCNIAKVSEAKMKRKTPLNRAIFVGGSDTDFWDFFEVDPICDTCVLGPNFWRFDSFFVFHGNSDFCCLCALNFGRKNEDFFDLDSMLVKM